MHRKLCNKVKGLVISKYKKMSNKNFKTIQQALKVSRKEYITPHYIRIYLTGDDISQFENTTIGVNNKILIPPKGVHEIHFPEFDYEKMQ